MDGLVILGAEINLAGKKPEVVKATIDWDAVKRQTKDCSIALRSGHSLVLFVLTMRPRRRLSI